jgi:hypothetical protein
MRPALPDPPRAVLLPVPERRARAWAVGMFMFLLGLSLGMAIAFTVAWFVITRSAA